ncbi:MAG: hypothetical protein QHI38_05620 [Armatimonadota bacterium]|nr:hypothetical protein [Armatimonadota bacterium]
MAKLSSSTGVNLIAGVDDNDWTVYDRKVVVYAKGIKLRALMRELAEVLRFQWRQVSEGNQTAYQLWQTDEQRAEEESLRNAAEDTQKLRAREKRESAISDLANLTSLSPAEAAALKTSDPWRYVLATEPLGKELAEFLNGCPAARNAFVQATELAFPVASLPQNLQENVRKLATSYDSLLHSIGASEDHAGLISQIEKLQVTINPRNTSQQPQFLETSILGRITIGTPREQFDIPIFDPSSPVAKALGKAIAALKDGKPKDDVATELQHDLASAVKSTVAQPETKRDITSDPALLRRIAPFKEQTVVTYPMALKALADSTGFNVISDYFPGRPVSIEGGEKSLGEYLEQLRTLFGANWEKTGNVIRFRDREWFRKRFWEVPQVWIDYWIARGDLNDGLQLQDLVQIANLRDEQIDNTIMLNSRLVNLGAGDAARNRHILRFYALLDESQRTELATKQLEVKSLRDEQWEALQKALASVGAIYAASAKSSQTIRLEQSGTDITEYRFSYYPGPNEPPVVFTVRTGLVYRTGREITLPPKRVVVPAPNK